MWTRSSLTILSPVAYVSKPHPLRSNLRPNAGFRPVWRLEVWNFRRMRTPLTSSRSVGRDHLAGLQASSRQRRAQALDLGPGRLDQRRSQATNTATLQLEPGLDQDAALSGEDPGVDGQQLLMKMKRRGIITGKVCLDQLLGSRSAEVCRRADHSYCTDRKQRQRHGVVTGVVRKFTFGDNSRGRCQVTLRILDGDDPRMLG